MSRCLLFTSLLLVCLTAPAAILTDQAPGTSTTAFSNQEFEPVNSAYDSYQVADITVGAPGWTINSISIYLLGFNSSPWPTTFNSRLNYFSRSAALPLALEDPTTGAVFSTTLTPDVGGLYKATISGLSLSLAPGDYWIGFTPIVGFDSYGQAYTALAAVDTGAAFTAWRNPGGGFGVTTSWSDLTVPGAAQPGDIAILIEGELNGPAIPEPSTVLLLGAGLAALALLKRR